MTSDSKVVYGIVSGSYSDYKIHSIYPTRELAEQAIASILRLPTESMYSGDGYSVEEFPWFTADRLPVPVTVYEVNENWWFNGIRSDYREMVHHEHEARRSWHAIPESSRPVVRWVEAPVHKGEGGRIEVRGLVKESVMKVLHDRRAQFCAERELS